VTGRIGPVLGFWEGLGPARHYRSRLRQALAEVAAVQPDVIVLIGFSGFHLPLGRRCRVLGWPVLYIAPPQVWAWGGFRVHILRQAADKVVCLFRFESERLQRYGIDASYFGYPFLDQVVAQRTPDQTRALLGFDQDDRYLVFLPGSRPSETRFHEPLFGQLFERLREKRPALKAVLAQRPNRQLPRGMSWNVAERFDVIRHADCAVVVSGTATAETAILGTPQVVCYHLAQPTRFLARLLVRPRFWAIPNIVAGRRVVPELLEPTVERLEQEVTRLLDNPGYREEMGAQLENVRHLLGPKGALERIAQTVVELGRNRASLERG